jgi:hypothetical protein
MPILRSMDAKVATKREEPVRYRIVVRGEMSDRFLEPLEMLSIESTGGESTLACRARDRAELQTALDWLFDRGVDIVSVNPLPAEDDDG